MNLDFTNIIINMSWSNEVCTLHIFTISSMKEGIFRSGPWSAQTVSQQYVRMLTRSSTITNVTTVFRVALLY